MKVNTSYNSIARTAQYISDLPPHPTISEFTLLFPTSHSEILKNWRAHLRSLKNDATGKVVAIIDGIVSVPGMLLPWEGMVKICKEEGAWSVVDAAHVIGQQPNLNLEESDPDFWVSVSDDEPRL